MDEVRENHDPTPDGPPDRPGTPTHVVGIGASAGGLEALEQFFGGVPAQTGLSFVVIQHLSPDYKSLMVELLSKRAAVPIRLAEDGVPLEADTAYVIPPGKQITVEGAKLRVTNQAQQRAPHLPVDRFLKSLADEFGDRSIAVILSGTGSDGARGVREVKYAGGMVMVQSGETAKFDGMPASAVETGLADYVLSPSAMGAQLVSYAQRVGPLPVRDGESLIADDETRLRIFARIRERHNIDFTYYRMSTVLRRIERRMGITRTRSVLEYAEVLDEDVAEVDTLYRELLIGVTSFFRDPDAFDRLSAEWRRQIAERSDLTEIRCWVAGCSTGEEAYSIVISLLEAVREAKSSSAVKVFATDIDQAALAKAAVGRYPESIAADVNPELLARYFVRKDHDFQVARSVRERVVFARHNLVRDPPFTNIDLVSCRNLLIYLQPVLQRRVLEHLNFALRSGGILFLGSSETIGDMLDYYEPLDHKWRIYRSRGSRFVPSTSLGELRGDPPRTWVRNADPRPVRSERDEQTLSRFLDSVGAEYLPLVLIADETFQLVHTIGEPGIFMRMPTGRTTIGITHLVVPDLAMPVGTGLQKVFGGETDVRYTNVRVATEDGTVLCHIRLRRLPDLRGQDPLAAVIIERDSRAEAGLTSEAGDAVTFDVESEQNRLIDDLQQELQFTRESLQATIEELETANEELQATNEELMASNEELQSTNEELQSVNEELHSVNAEYQEKILELTELNNDLENLFDNTDAAMMFIDENLEVRRANDRMRSLVGAGGLVPGTRFTAETLALEGIDVAARVRDANDSNESWEGPARGRDGRTYFVRVRPYQLALEVFAGVTLTLVDITSLSETRDALAASRERYATLVERLHDAVVVYRVEGDRILIDDMNRTAREIGGVVDAARLPQAIEDVWPEVDSLGIPETIRSVAESGESKTNEPQLYVDEHVQLWTTSRFFRIGDGVVVGVFHDVSHESRLQQLLEAAGLGWWEWDVATGRVKAGAVKSRLAGYEPGEAGTDVSDWIALIHEDDHDRVMDAVRRVLEGETDRFDHEYRLRAGDGSFRRVRDTGSVSGRRADGSPSHLVGWVQAADEAPDG